MNFDCKLSRRTMCVSLASASLLGTSFRSESRVAATQPTLFASEAASRANAFLASLDDKQKRKANLEFDDERRQTWHFVPLPARKGLELRSMKDNQFALAIDLLRSVVSDYGFKRCTDTMSYENILLQLEGADRAEVRDYKKYNFTVFGEPSDKGLWGLSIEGHHLSLNLTFSEAKVVDSTPQFFGVNPAAADKDYTVPSVVELGTEYVVKKGARLLGPEEDAGFDLLSSLTGEQKSVAILSAECPADVLWGGVTQPRLIDQVGISASKLTESQSELLVKLIGALQCSLPNSVCEDRLELIRNADLGTIHFAWAGATTRDKQHYYRVHGPTFFAEYCNYQADSAGNIPNHIHCVWRDLTGDFNEPLKA